MSYNLTSKTCFKCLVIKPLNMFYTHKQMRDGRLNKCIECTKSDSTKNRNANIDRVRLYDQERSKLPHRVELRKKIFDKWRIANPERRAAIIALNNAVRDCRVKRHPCWVCGEKAEAHHPDYSRPLDVVWLCAVHHRQTHAMKLG